MASATACADGPDADSSGQGGRAARLAKSPPKTVIRPFLIPVALLVAAFGYQLGWALFASVPRIVGNITNDDTFLYLEFARNTVASGFPTFDGLHVTNGVQPLWGGALVLLAALFEDKVALLRATLALCAVLNLAAGLALLRAAERLRSRVAVVVVGACWAGYMNGLSPSMMGMENSLHALGAAVLVLALIHMQLRTAKPTAALLMLFGLLLALNAGARLDSAVVSLVLGIVILRRATALGMRWRVAVPLVFGPGALAAGVFYELGEAYFGVGLPVSGAMKIYYAERYLDGAAPWLWPAYVIGAVLKTWLAAPQWLLSRFAWEALQSATLGVVLGVVLLPMAVDFFAPRRAGTSPAADRIASLCRVLAAAVLAYMLVLACGILHFSMEPWYHSWLLIAWIWILCWAVERWAHSAVLPAAGRGVVLAGLGLALAFVQGVGIWRQAGGHDEEELHVARMRMAPWLDANLPAGARVGAWNAGILAYFSDLTLVNLDGLMNSAEYAAWVRSGGDVRESLKRLGIDVIVDYNDKDSTMPMLAELDRRRSFRGLWTWDEVSVLHSCPTGDGRQMYVISLGRGL